MPTVAGKMMAGLAYGEGAASQSQDMRGMMGKDHIMDTQTHVDAPHGQSVPGKFAQNDHAAGSAGND